jgi:hypothetical protein
MKVTVATSADELAAISAQWADAAPASPHASERLFQLVTDTVEGIERPHVMMLHAEGREPILVVGRIERRPLRITVGYRTLLRADAR